MLCSGTCCAWRRGTREITTRPMQPVTTPSSGSMLSPPSLFSFWGRCVLHRYDSLSLLPDHCQGLRTFNTPRYRQFAKRLGRLIRHTVGFYIWSRRSSSLSRFTMCLTTGRLSNWPRVMHWTHPCCCDCKSNMTTSSYVLQGRILGTHFFVH